MTLFIVTIAIGQLMIGVVLGVWLGRIQGHYDGYQGNRP